MSSINLGKFQDLGNRVSLLVRQPQSRALQLHHSSITFHFTQQFQPSQLKPIMNALNRAAIAGGGARSFRTARFSSTQPAQPKEESSIKSETASKVTKQAPEPRLMATDPPIPKKTIAQLDEELRQKMAGLGGDGGAAGVEYEDGRPADMKRSVRNNMFRYI